MCVAWLKIVGGDPAFVTMSSAYESRGEQERKRAVMAARQILGISHDVEVLSPEIIRRAFRKAALNTHPDKVMGCEGKDSTQAMQLVNASNEFLTSYLRDPLTTFPDDLLLVVIVPPPPPPGWLHADATVTEDDGSDGEGEGLVLCEGEGLVLCEGKGLVLCEGWITP